MIVDGFYAILDRDDEGLARALVSVARVLQIRLKDAPVDELTRVARMARRVCDAAGVALVVNDRVDVALAIGADGVHLGQTDLPLAAARAIAGDRLAIGVSTHDLAQVRAAVAGGANYLGYGPVFPTRTKANPSPVQGLDALRAAVVAAGTVPIVAIGGITPAVVADVYATGVAAACAIGAINDAADVGVAASEMRRRAGSRSRS
ncbi:MAG: thiamine phosphate synthase [Proteobacteria bacterium]|nr:thiamine phosphate synthase [Pseudomonadota bacterium]